MTDRELMQQVLDALNHVNVQDRVQIITALRERLAQPEQESVKFCTYPKCQTTAGCAGVCARQNTTPQPRQWVGLTDEEIEEMHNEIKVRLMGTYRTEDIYRSIEAKLREKNHG